MEAYCEQWQPHPSIIPLNKNLIYMPSPIESNVYILCDRPFAYKAKQSVLWRKKSKNKAVKRLEHLILLCMC